MKTVPYSHTEVAALRDEMCRFGQKLSSTTAWEILRKTGDRDLAVTALLLNPRPDWLAQITKDGTD